MSSSRLYYGDAPGPLSLGDRILGVDPGGTTGLCLAEYLGRIDIQPLISMNLRWDNWTEELINLLLEWKPRVTVCENFIVYQNKSDDLRGSDVPSAQVIGALKGWMAHPLTRYSVSLTLQMASEIQSYQVLPQHVQLVGVKIAGDPTVSLEHRKDSYKHVRRFVASSVLRPP